jgi:hypothetical protein
MRIFDIRSQVLGYSVMLLLSMSTMAWAEEPPLPLSGEGQARGVVLGIVGMPVRIVAPAATPGGTLNVGDVISAGDELRVGTGEQVALLWDHRAVLTLREGARMNIQESHRGQTELLLHQGMVRIALSYNAGRMTDTLTLSDTAGTRRQPWRHYGGDGIGGRAAITFGAADHRTSRTIRCGCWKGRLVLSH